MRKSFSNIFALATTQGFNALLPIFIFPLLLSRLGSDKYSLIAVSEVVSIILLTFVIYSFEISGLTAVVRNRENNFKEISFIYSRIIATRLFIWFVGLLAVYIVCLFLDQDYFYVIAAWSLVPLGYAFQATYVFQGLEQNWPVACFTLVSRLICVLVIFLYSQESWSAYLAPLIIGVSYLVTGLASTLYLLVVLKIRWVWVPFQSVQQSLIEGFDIFRGHIAILLYRDCGVLFLNFMGVSSVGVSNYSIAEKLVKAVQATMRPLNQFFYPRVVSQLHPDWKPSRETFEILARKTKPQIILVLGAIILGYAGFWILKNKLGVFSQDPVQINDIMILSAIMVPAAVFGIVNFMFGITGLNNLGEQKYLSKAFILNAIVILLLTFITIQFFAEFGAAFSFLMAEVVLMILILMRYFKR